VVTLTQTIRAPRLRDVPRGANSGTRDLAALDQGGILVAFLQQVHG